MGRKFDPCMAHSILKCQNVNYGAYSSAVERQIVDLVVVGSIPTRHPKVHYCNLVNAPVAHLDRATDFESVGGRFESCQTHK